LEIIVHTLSMCNLFCSVDLTFFLQLQCDALQPVAIALAHLIILWQESNTGVETPIQQ